MPLINTYKYRFKESYAPETVVQKTYLKRPYKLNTEAAMEKY